MTSSKGSVLRAASISSSENAEKESFSISVTAAHIVLYSSKASSENETFLLLHNTDTEDATLDLAANSKLTDYKSYSIRDYIGVGSAKIEGATVTLGGQTSVIINCK